MKADKCACMLLIIRTSNTCAMYLISQKIKKQQNNYDDRDER